MTPIAAGRYGEGGLPRGGEEGGQRRGRLGPHALARPLGGENWRRGLSSGGMTSFCLRNPFEKYILTQVEAFDTVFQKI